MRIRSVLVFLLASSLGPAAGFADNWTCYPAAETCATVTVNYAAKTDGELQVYGGVTGGSIRRREGALRFDISAIPPTTVTAIQFHFYVNLTYWPYWNITPVTNDPVTDTAGVLWTDINAEATSGYYNQNTESSSYAVGWKTLVLGGSANADLTAIVNHDKEWFAFGALDYDSSATYYLEIDGRLGPNVPYLVVYDDPPPPNDTCAAAVVIPGSAGLHSYTEDTRFAADDYNCAASCVGGLSHPGQDVAYRVTLPEGCEMCVTVNQSEIPWNAGVCMVTDCADVNGTCVAGASGWTAGGLDETFCYEGTGTFYLIVDGRAASESGTFRLDVAINCISGPTDLTCTSTAAEVQLAWTNNEPYAQIEVYTDGALAATLPGTASFYSVVPADKGYHCFHVVAWKADGSHETSNTCCTIWGFDQVTVYDFEADDGGFVADHTGWAWGTLSDGPCIAGAAGNVWATRLAASYDNNACWLLDSPGFDLADKGGFVCLDHCFSIEDSWDGGNVWFTTDDSRYFRLDPVEGYPGTSNGAIDDCPWVDAQPVFTGESSGWVSDCWDLTDPPWAGQTVRMRLAFGSDSSVSYPGWSIDAVTLWTNAGGTFDCSYTIVPASGTVPFQPTHTVIVTSLYLGQAREIAGRIDVQLANGSSYSNWRSGNTTLDPGESYTLAFSARIPAQSPVIGSNLFILRAQDVTSSPFNQPPYPPEGDLCEVMRTVVAHWP